MTGTNYLGLMEAVKSTLELDPTIKLQDKNVAFARGRFQEERGRFDARVASAVINELTQFAEPQVSVVSTPSGSQTTTSLERLVNNETTFRLGVDQPLRSGLVIGPGIEMTRSEDNVSAVDPRNRAEVNFTVIVPLARGFGKRVTTADERAARLDLEAARLNLEHTVSQRVLNTASAYWNYRAASRRLEILQESERRAQDLYESTRKLVQAQEVAAAELDQLQANLAGKNRGRIAADQSFYEARQDLGLAMGQGYDAIDRLPLHGDAFPAPGEDVSLPELVSLQELFSLALLRRADLQSSQLNEESASILVDASRDRLKPQIDLTLRVGYEGFEEGSAVTRSFAAYSDNVEGVNAFAALSFAWPPANNSARGRLLQQQSIHDQAAIRSRDLARLIRSGLSVAMRRLSTSIAELRKAAEATSAYRKAVENERNKRRLGLASFTDVLLVEDRLTSAELDHVDAQASYGVALALVRFEAGMLLEGDPTGQAVTWDTLTTLPTILWTPPTPPAP